MAISQIGYTDVAEQFLDQGCDVDGRNPSFWASPLAYATYYGHYDLVELYIERGADVERMFHHYSGVEYC